MKIVGMVFVNDKYIDTVDEIEYASKIIEIDFIDLINKTKPSELIDKLNVTVGIKVVEPKNFTIIFRMDKKNLPDFWNNIVRRNNT